MASASGKTNDTPMSEAVSLPRTDNAPNFPKVEPRMDKDEGTLSLHATHLYDAVHDSAKYCRYYNIGSPESPFPGADAARKIAEYPITPDVARLKILQEMVESPRFSLEAMRAKSTALAASAMAFQFCERRFRDFHAGESTVDEATVSLLLVLVGNVFPLLDPFLNFIEKINKLDTNKELSKEKTIQIKDEEEEEY